MKKINIEYVWFIRLIISFLCLLIGIFLPEPFNRIAYILGYFNLIITFTHTIKKDEGKE